jgi:hypothetical protein
MCEEYARLLYAYKRALNFYIGAVADTSDIPPAELERVNGYVDQARAAAIVAGMELEDHCEEHGCAQFREAASNKT